MKCQAHSDEVSGVKFSSARILSPFIQNKSNNSQNVCWMFLMKKLNHSNIIYLLFFTIELFLICSNVGLGLADPDYFWQIKTGQVIYSNGALPSTDPFSYTAANNTLPKQEWLSQVLMYRIHALFGDYSIILFIAFVSAAAWYCSFQSAKIFSRSSVLSLACALFFAPGMILFLTPRPQLFSFFFFAFFLNKLLLAKYSDSWRSLYIFPVLMVFWVNMHGAFIIGLALILAFALAEGTGAIGVNVAESGTRFRRFFLTFVACLGASLLNPEGLDGLLFPFRLISLHSVQLISEFRPLDLSGTFGQIALASGVLFFALNGYRKRVPELLELALPMSMFVAGMTTLRYYPFTVLTLIPFLAQAIAEGAVLGLIAGPLRFLTRPFAVLTNLWRTLMRHWQFSRDDKGLFLVRWLAVGVVFFVVTPFLLTHSWSKEKRDARLPIGAVNFVKANSIQGRMFNNYNIGGYLLYCLYPDRKVFIDPRADLYGDQFFKRYLTIIRAEDGWREALAEWHIDYAILQSSDPIRSALLRDGEFAGVYDDGRFVVMVRREPRFETLIDATASAIFRGNNDTTDGSE